MKSHISNPIGHVFIDFNDLWILNSQGILTFVAYSSCSGLLLNIHSFDIFVNHQAVSPRKYKRYFKLDLFAYFVRPSGIIFRNFKFLYFQTRTLSVCPPINGIPSQTRTGFQPCWPSNSHRKTKIQSFWTELSNVLGWWWQFYSKYKIEFFIAWQGTKNSGFRIDSSTGEVFFHQGLSQKKMESLKL